MYFLLIFLNVLLMVKDYDYIVVGKVNDLK